MLESKLKIKVIPNASRNEVSGWFGDMLKIKVMQQAEDGKANKAVIKLLANHFKLSESAIEIIEGSTSQIKTIKIQGDIKLSD